jgi:hypothetical protein
MRKFFAALLALLGMGTSPAASSGELKGGDQVIQDLRSMVFALKPSDIGLDRKSFPGQVWGVVMETGMDSGFYTLVVLADGTTSLYFSTGGGIIGAGEHSSVRTESVRYLAIAESASSTATPSNSFPPPTAGQTSFYFFTFDGTRSYSAKEVDLGEQRDKLSELFHAAHSVIASVRQAQP